VPFLRSKEFDVLKTEPNNQDIHGDPPARFATDAEIKIADQLRRQIEERYLALSATSSPLLARSGQPH